MKLNAWWVVGLALALGGCDIGEPLEQTQAWYAREKASIPKSTDVVQPPVYQAPAPIPPTRWENLFSDDRLSAGLKGPEDAQRALRFPLSAHGMDQMVYVGTLLQDRRKVGLVRLGEKTHVVRPGDLIGRNGGRVTQLFDDRLEFSEQVRMPNGQWKEQKGELLIDSAVKKEER